MRRRKTPRRRRAADACARGVRATGSQLRAERLRVQVAPCVEVRRDQLRRRRSEILLRRAWQLLAAVTSPSHTRPTHRYGGDEDQRGGAARDIREPVRNIRRPSGHEALMQLVVGAVERGHGEGKRAGAGDAQRREREPEERPEHRPGAEMRDLVRYLDAAGGRQRAAGEPDKQKPCRS